MSYIIKYLHTHLKPLIFLLLFSLIFAAAFALYRLPAAAVIYPAVLCLVILLIAAVFDFQRFRRSQQTLDQLEDMTDILLHNIELADKIPDEICRRIIELLINEHRRLITERERQTNEACDYYAAWAHQIKTPIAALRLALQSEDSELSLRLNEEICRIEQYVDMVMCYVRLDSDSTDFVFREYELDDILKQAIKRYASQFILKKLTLDYTPCGCRLVTDEKWLLFVIEQILSNSLKYTQKGGIRIFMDGSRLCIVDTGIGIAPEDLPRIFEKGFTGCNGRENKKASGIGLYLCRQICAKLGHEISACCPNDGGTEINIDLSQKRAEDF